jgi:hypothetical protein
MTIEDIVHTVTDTLSTTPAGIGRVREMDALANSLNGVDLRKARALIRVRPGISFSVNTTQARWDRPTVSVRAHGVECGRVFFELAGRLFEPHRRFMSHWKTRAAQRRLEWGEHAVSRFIADCERDARKDWTRESRIQDLLFRQMHGGGRKKIGLLRNLQPVLFGGLPIQLPSPATPRAAAEEYGSRKGHSDIVARSREHGRLVVFEIKRPAAKPKECIEALGQAVTYAAALDYLLSREEHRAAYWRLLGSQRGPRHAPKFSAVAFLHQEAITRCQRGLRDEIIELKKENSKDYRLSIMLYNEVANDIEVKPFDE